MEFIDHFNEICAEFLALRQNKKAKKHTSKKFVVEQAYKYDLSTLFLANDVGCCLAVGSSHFSAMIQRILDDAMQFHVVRDYDTKKVVALTWIYFAVVNIDIDTYELELLSKQAQLNDSNVQEKIIYLSEDFKNCIFRVGKNVHKVQLPEEIALSALNDSYQNLMKIANFLKQEHPDNLHEVKLIANFFEINTSYTHNNELKQGLLRGMIEFTKQFCLDNNIVDANGEPNYMMNTLSYGYFMDCLNDFEKKALGYIDKLGGPYVPGEYNHNAETKEAYYLSSLSSFYLHQFNQQSLESICPHSFKLSKTKKTENDSPVRQSTSSKTKSSSSFNNSSSLFSAPPAKFRIPTNPETPRPGN